MNQENKKYEKDVNEKPKKLIDELRDKDFFGKVTFTFKNGKIVHADEGRSYTFE